MTTYQKRINNSDVYSKFNQDPYSSAYTPMPLGHRPNPRKEQHSSRSLKKEKLPVESHEYFIAFVVDPVTGKVSRRCSPSLKHYSDDALFEAGSKLAEHCRLLLHNGFDPLSTYQDDQFGSIPAPEQIPNGKSQAERPKKRRKGVDEHDMSDPGSVQDEDPASDRSPHVSFRADAAEEWQRWFYNAFRAVQQVSCRIIAKEWIKAIHPKKQSTHPYNGKDPRTGERGDPSSTRPPYWPSDVIHKEPDHINKEARTKLLVHLLMNTPHKEMSVSGDSTSDKEICAKDLRDSLKQKKQESQHKDLKKKFYIVEAIIEVRSNLEQFNDGGLPGSAMIMAPDFSDITRTSKPEDDSDEADDGTETIQNDDTGEDEMDVLVDTSPRETAVNTKIPTPVIQQDHTSDKEKRARKNRKGSGRSESAYPTSVPPSKQAPLPTAPSAQHLDMPFHPPLIIPEWSTYPTGANIISKQEHMPHPTLHNHSPHEIFGSIHWNTQSDAGMEMTSQFNNYCMISPSHMVNPDAANSYVHDCYSESPQQHFTVMPHPQYGRQLEYHEEISNHRAVQEREMNGFQSFMMPPPSSHDLASRGYYAT